MIKYKGSNIRTIVHGKVRNLVAESQAEDSAPLVGSTLYFVKDVDLTISFPRRSVDGVFQYRDVTLNLSNMGFKEIVISPILLLEITWSESETPVLLPSIHKDFTYRIKDEDLQAGVSVFKVHVKSNIELNFNETVVLAEDLNDFGYAGLLVNNI